MTMTLKNKFKCVIEYFEKNMPVAESELNFENPYQLIVAVILSAQCTDKRVNMTTPALFERYPDAEALSKAAVEDIYELIKSISYPNNKSKNLLGMAKVLMSDFNGVLHVNVYDKDVEYNTNGNETDVFSFKLKNSVIYMGKTEVKDGKFNASFVLPKDINYSYGNGLMSFYANSDKTDAQGSYSNFIVGLRYLVPMFDKPINLSELQECLDFFQSKRYSTKKTAWWFNTDPPSCFYYFSGYLKSFVLVFSTSRYALASAFAASRLSSR